MHSKVRNIPRNTQLRGRLFDKWPRKGLSGACCGPSGEVSGAPTGRGPACSAAQDGDGQGVLRWSRGGTSAFSGAGQGGAGGSAVEPGGGASVFSGAGRGQAGGSAVEPGRGQRVQRWGPVRDGGGTGGGSAAQAGAGPACSAARDRGGTGSSEVQTGRAGRREGGGGMASRPPPRPLPKAAAGCKADGRAAGSQKKCSEGKMRPPPGRKKSVPRGRCAAARTHTGTKKTDLGPFTSISATLLCYSTGFCSGMLVRYTLPRDNGSALREPVSLRATSGSMFSCNSLSAFDFGLPVGRGHSRESLRHPEPQPLSRPPVGSQFSAAGVTVLSRPGSRPSAARNLPSLLLAPSAAGVTAPPRQYGRPPATGESPASSLRRASPARDSTAYRPAP